MSRFSATFQWSFAVVFRRAHQSASDERPSVFMTALVDPLTVPLNANPLEAPFDPIHSHEPGFVSNVAGNWSLKPGCAPAAQGCPQYFSSLSYVPTPIPGPTSSPAEVANYISLIQKWAYASHVLQSNEGPSFVSHQYAIAGQSGGLTDSSITPDGMTENPFPSPTPPSVGPPLSDQAAIGGGSCATSTGAQNTNMNTPYPGNQGAQQLVPTCNEYPTIFDILAGTQPRPAGDIWQYIAVSTKIIWSGPMAGTHLYNQYISGNPPKAQQPFAADPNAYNFVTNLENDPTPNPVLWPIPNPTRPFASLTYITPCVAESDHPNFSTYSDGPQWLAYVLNAIGASPYWQNTAVIVTWDDWGGFYDGYRAPGGQSQWPFHPKGNAYNNPQDPNEWGIRVPLIVISPYVAQRGYISTTQRSQGAILNFIESVFSLPQHALNGDDAANGADDLGDMFNFASPLPWQPLPTTFPTPAPGQYPPTICPHS